MKRTKRTNTSPHEPSGESEEATCPEGLPAGEIVDVSLSQIALEDTDLEVRRRPGVDDLAKNIRRNGQQFPVVVRPIAGTDKYQIICGFRRCRALQELGWPNVKAIVRTDLDDDAAYRLSFLENERRRSLTSMDKANAIARLRLRGKSDMEVGEIYEIGHRQIRRYLQLSTFPKILMEAIGAHRIEHTHALVLMSEHPGHDENVDFEEWVTSWIDRIELEKLSVPGLCKTLNKAKSGKRDRHRILEHTKNGGFKLYSMRFDPSTTNDVLRQKIVERLREAIAIVERK